ncbi:conjugal transfer protein TraB [Streptomyces qinglanensis]|uniref:conjugal transfer protein TraB n=1 Tax=Streptomyces qinglanensis TaxID=943816 RepID=UPI0037A75E2F
MSSELAPRRGTAAVPADNDNRYKAIQAKLDKFGKALEDATRDLERLRNSMHANAAHADSVATDIENAELDPKFVSLTANVASALGGAAHELRTLADTAQETTDLTHQTRRTHAKLYGALDEVRSNRREKTAKPGFFAR